MNATQATEVLGHVAVQLEKRGYHILGVQKRESKIP